MDVQIEDLKKIIEAIIERIVSEQETLNLFNEAVLWKSVYLMGVYPEVIDNSTFYVADIQGASPSAYKFITFIYDELERYGINNVKLSVDW